MSEPRCEGPRRFSPQAGLVPLVLLALACVGAACGGWIADNQERAPADGSTPELHADGEPRGDECPFRSIRIDLTQVGTARLTNGVEVEPLQVPTFSAETRGDPAQPSAPVWDDSPVPAGACVFRLRGVDASCYRKSAQLFLGLCDEHLISPSSFYEQRGCNETPRCAGPAWGSPSLSFWWYLAPAAVDSNLVLCAAECAQEISARGACLFLDSDSRLCPP
jgi:hypothetical protein